MSNQVYSNDTQRYVEQKGICKFAATNVGGLMANGTAIPLVFTNTPLIPDQNVSGIVLNDPSGLVEVQNDGVYTIGVQIKLNTEDTFAFTYDAFLELRFFGAVPTIIKLAENFCNHANATPAQLEDSTFLTTTIYLPAHSSFWAVVTNRNSAHDPHLNSANITITKIA